MPVTESREGGGGGWKLDASALAIISGALHVPAFLAARSLDFNDSVYGASALAMRSGELPFRDVYSSQGPLFLPLIYVFDLLGGRSSQSPRLVSALAGVAAVLATYFAARTISTRLRALIAASLVAFSGSWLWAAGAITSDGVSGTFAAWAIALALGLSRPHEAQSIKRSFSGRQIGIGIMMGAALSVKFLVLPVAIPVGILLLSRTGWRGLLKAIGAAFAVLVAATLPWGADLVWDQSVAFQLGSAREASLLENVAKFSSVLSSRDPLIVIGLVLAAILWSGLSIGRLLRGRNQLMTPPITEAPDAERPRRAAWLVNFSATAALSIWASGQAALLIAEPALWSNHMTHVVIPMALLVVCRFPLIDLHLGCLKSIGDSQRAAFIRAACVAVVCIVAATFQVSRRGDILSPEPYKGSALLAFEALDDLPNRAQVITDEPGFTWRADLIMPAFLVDPSYKRLDDGQITLEVILSEAASDNVCAVLVWSQRHYGRFEALPDALSALGYSRVTALGGPRVLYERPECGPIRRAVEGSRPTQ